VSKGQELSAILRGRGFQKLYGTRLVSQLSDGVFQAALAAFVFFDPQKETSPTRAATAFAVLLLPYSLVGPFAGVFIDRWSRRQILLVAPCIRAALTLAIAALVAAGNEGPLFYLAALLVLGVNRFFLSALSAALPHVVGGDQLVLANSLATTSGTVIAFVGAGLGYVLRLVFGGGGTGTGIILLWCSGAYVLASAIARLMGRDQLGPALDQALPETRQALGGVLRGLLDGARHVRSRPQAALALAAISLHRFLYGIVLIMAALLYRNTFATSANAGLGGFSVFLTASGAGFLLGALVTPSVADRIGKDAWIAGQLACSAGAVLLLGLPFRPAAFVALGLVLGVVSQGVKLSVDTILQERMDDVYRGRVFSAYDMLFNATFVGAAAVAAAALPPSGRSVPVLLGLAVAYGLAAALYASGIRAVRPVAQTRR
jgi:MFS family permease